MVATLERIATVGLAGITDGAREAGQTFDKKMIAKAQAFNDAWDRVFRWWKVAIVDMFSEAQREWQTFFSWWNGTPVAAAQRDLGAARGINDLDRLGKSGKSTVIPKTGTDKSKEETDSFEWASAALEKRIGLLEIEARPAGASTYERERAKKVLELETAAREANAKAGKGENTVTAKQRAAIDKLAEAYGPASEAAEKAKKNQEELKKALKSFGHALTDAFTDAIVEGKKRMRSSTL